jgi:hypothetical protein
LEEWKYRFKIKQYRQHSEAKDADIDNPDNIRQMEALHAKCRMYANRDIFNMDKTGLFWKLSPNRILATTTSSGGKQAKDRITIALTTNADGSEKLEPWIIGKSKNSRCFKNIKNRSLLHIQYRYNKTKWITGEIYRDYLQ